MSLNANWGYPTAIRFGAGRISELADVCKDAGINKPLFVTDPGVAPLPITEQALDVLDKAGLGRALFSDIKPNPTASNVEAGLTMYRDGGHDGVVAFGGGSAMDAGKVIAFMSGQTRPMWDFEDIGDWWTRADESGIAPIIAVPTTSGTGSEVGRAGVITDEENHVKKIIFHPLMLPKTVICDPALVAGLPPFLTAGTGLDAFVHCLEAYCSPHYHPMSEGIAVEGMRLIKDYLPRAYDDGSDIEARAHVMSAAAMGAVAFQKGLGGIHAMAHPLGALYDTPHGLTNAVLMPYMLKDNRPAIEDKIVRLACWLQLEDQSFDGFFQYILDLRERLGIPHTIKEIGVDDKQFDLLAKMSVEDPSSGGNPVEMSVENSMKLYRQAYNGVL